MAEYVILDAVTGNTDRHHENWGILRRRTGNSWRQVMAPSFDHASSLGRELQDAARRRILTGDRIGVYSERARGAIYWTEDDPHAPGPLELVRRAVDRHPAVFEAALTKLDDLDDESIGAVVGRVPEDWMMSPAARAFAVALMCYNLDELKKLNR